MFDLYELETKHGRKLKQQNDSFVFHNSTLNQQKVQHDTIIIF